MRRSLYNFASFIAGIFLQNTWHKKLPRILKRFNFLNYLNQSQFFLNTTMSSKETWLNFTRLFAATEWISSLIFLWTVLECITFPRSPDSLLRFNSRHCSTRHLSFGIGLDSYNMSCSLGCTAFGSFSGWQHLMAYADAGERGCRTYHNFPHAGRSALQPAGWVAYQYILEPGACEGRLYILFHSLQ